MYKRIKRLLIILLIFSNFFAFSAWQQGGFDIYKNILSNTEASSLTRFEVKSQNIRQETMGNLIPESAFTGVGDTHEIIIDYNIHLNEEVGSDRVLIVKSFNIKVGNLDNPYNIVKIRATNSIIVKKDVTISIHITLDISHITEENQEDAFRSIMNKEITFDLAIIVV